MSDSEGVFTAQYLKDCSEHVAGIEADLLAIEKGGAAIDDDLASRLCQAVRAIDGGAEVFHFAAIREVAQKMEEAVTRICSREMAPTAARVSVLLRATDALSALIENPGPGYPAEHTEILAALAGVCVDPGAGEARAVQPERARSAGGPLRMLLAEDDFASRLLLQTFLSRYGECHVAVHGREAVEAVRLALQRERNYDLICMDIMMPEMDGREAVRQIRGMEEAQGIFSPYGAKIVMTTTVDDIREVIHCFKELCDAYLVKPIDLGILLGHMKSYKLVA
jgi:two-component system chemotaxis response regulator CheY